MTVVPARGLAAVVPWISAIGTTSPAMGGSGSGSGSMPPPFPAAFVGVGAAVVKSAELLSVSTAPLRLRDVVTDAAVDATVS